MNMYSVSKEIELSLNKRYFMCGICDARFYIQSELRSHINSHKKSVLLCSICNKTFLNRENFDKHSLMHSKPTKNYNCTVCGSELSDQAKLILHIRNMHPTHMITRNLEELSPVKSSPSSFRISPLSKNRVLQRTSKGILYSMEISPNVKKSPQLNAIQIQASSTNIETSSFKKSPSPKKSTIPNVDSSTLPSSSENLIQLQSNLGKGKKSILKTSKTPVGKRKPVIWKDPIVSQEISIGNSPVSVHNKQFGCSKRKHQSYFSESSPKKQRTDHYSKVKSLEHNQIFIAPEENVGKRSISLTPKTLPNKMGIATKKKTINKTKLMQSISCLYDDQSSALEEKTFSQTRNDLVKGKQSSVTKGPIRIVSRSNNMSTPSTGVKILKLGDSSDNQAFTNIKKRMFLMQKGQVSKKQDTDTSCSGHNIKIMQKFNTVGTISPQNLKMVKLGSSTVSTISPQNLKLVSLGSSTICTKSPPNLKMVKLDSFSIKPSPCVRNISPGVKTQDRNIGQKLQKLVLLNNSDRVDSPQPIFRQNLFTVQPQILQHSTPKQGLANINKINDLIPSERFFSTGDQTSFSKEPQTIVITEVKSLNDDLPNVLNQNLTITQNITQSQMSPKQDKTLSNCNISETPVRFPNKQQTPTTRTLEKKPSIRSSRKVPDLLEGKDLSGSVLVRSPMNQKLLPARKNVKRVPARKNVKKALVEPSHEVLKSEKFTEDANVILPKNQKLPLTRNRLKQASLETRHGIQHASKSEVVSEGAEIKSSKNQKMPFCRKRVKRASLEPVHRFPEVSKSEKVQEVSPLNQKLPLARSRVKKAAIDPVYGVNVLERQEVVTNSQAGLLKNQKLPLTRDCVKKASIQSQQGAQLASERGEVSEDAEVTLLKKQKLAPTRNHARRASIKPDEKDVIDVASKQYVSENEEISKNADVKSQTLNLLFPRVQLQRLPEYLNQNHIENKHVDIQNTNKSSTLVTKEYRKIIGNGSVIDNNADKGPNEQLSPPSLETTSPKNIRVIPIPVELMKQFKETVLKNCPSTTSNHIRIVVPPEFLCKIQKTTAENEDITNSTKLVTNVQNKNDSLSRTNLISPINKSSSKIIVKSVEDLLREEKERKETKQKMMEKEKLLQKMLAKYDEKEKKKQKKYLEKKLARFVSKHRQHLRKVEDQLLNIHHLSPESGSKLIEDVRDVNCMECRQVIGSTLCTLGFGEMEGKSADNQALLGFINLSTSKAKKKQNRKLKKKITDDPKIKRSSVGRGTRRNNSSKTSKEVSIKFQQTSKSPKVSSVCPRRNLNIGTELIGFNLIQSSVNKSPESYSKSSCDVTKSKSKATPQKTGIIRKATPRRIKRNLPYDEDPFTDFSLITGERHILKCPCNKTNCNGLHLENFLI